MRRVVLVVLGVLCVVLLGIATNVATSSWPGWARPYLWLAWPVLIASALALAALEFARGRAAVPSAVDGRVRAILLDRVHRYAVQGILDRSLYEEVRFELGIEAVETRRHPWDVIASSRAGTRVVSSRAQIGGVFDDLDRSVVILGEPGAGKTTTLLELARDLLERARQDADQPVPVYLQLSRWALQRRPLADWLVAELASQYGIPRPQAAALVAADGVVPLLDGLDEVGVEHRDAAVAAIDGFHASHTLVPLAVCCRTGEYGGLAAAPKLYGTLTVQPLTRAQVGRFLDLAGASVAGVRAALAADPELWDMITSPLLLSIMTLAFRDERGPDVPGAGAGTPQERRARLYATYVATMLRHRRHPHYGPDDTVRWLTYLAANLVATQQTTFSLNAVGPAWLRAGRWRSARRTARLGVSAAAAVLLTALGGGLLGWSGAAVGAVAGLLTARAIGWGSHSLKEITWAERLDRTGFLPPLRWTGRVRRAMWRTVHLDRWGPVVLAWCAAGGIAAGMAAGAALGPAAGAAVGVAGTAVAWLSYRWHDDYLGGRIAGDALPRREVPSPLLRRWVGPAAVGALGCGPVAGLLAGLIVGLAVPAATAYRYGLLFGAAALLYPLLAFAGALTAEQWMVRRLLARDGAVPYPYLPFLDYAAQCLFLRRTGSNYIFVHRELLEHFAGRRQRWRRQRSRV